MRWWRRGCKKFPGLTEFTLTSFSKQTGQPDFCPFFFTRFRLGLEELLPRSLEVDLLFRTAYAATLRKNLAAQVALFLDELLVSYNYGYLNIGGSGSVWIWDPGTATVRILGSG